MNEETLIRALPLMFREAKVPERAKEELRRLFRQTELTDDELGFVAAAGDLAEQERRNRNENKK